MTKTCTRPGCERPTGPRGYCTACYQTYRKRQVAYGRWDVRTDPEPARAHLKALLAQGMTGRRVAEATGLAQRTITDINTGRYATIATQTANLILNCHPNVPLERLSPNQKVDATGTIRRLQALMAMGWPGGKISAELGWRNEQLQRTRAGGHTQVTARTAIRVRDLYDRLWNIDGGDTRSRNTAIRKGWALPLEWDNIDNPSETPSGRRNPNPHAHENLRAARADRRDAVAEWMNNPDPHKATAAQLATRLGVTEHTIDMDKAAIRAEHTERNAA